ncbi:MAG TPA: LacI family DNA-binding transcriptional regulator [Gryllotalpicola sp.]
MTEQPAGSRATMSDVGKRAGVSHQTVSRVLNEPWRVSRETQQRVLDAIADLKFHPNTVARALARQRSGTIGMVSTGIALHSHSKRMIAFNEAARAAGYQVSMASVATADAVSLRDAIETLIAQNVEGIVLIAADEGAIDVMRSLAVPVPVVFAESSGRSGPDNVSIDQFVGGRMAAAHLAELGHRQIAHLAGPGWSLDASERLRGWSAELSERGIPARTPIRAADWTPDSGYRTASLIAAMPEVTAVFASSDQLALGLLHGLEDQGLRVPQDLSVVGFDGQPEAAHFHPPLTTIRQDFAELGRRLMGAMAAKLEGEALPELPPLVPELVVRKSTAPRFLAAELAAESEPRAARRRTKV